MSVALLAGAGILASASMWAQDAQVAAREQAATDYHGIASNPRDIRRYDRVIGLSMRWAL